MANTMASPANTRNAIKMAVERWQVRCEYTVPTYVKNVLYILYTIYVCETLTYIAVDRVCISNYGAVRGVVEIFHPQRIVSMLPKVEGNPKS